MQKGYWISCYREIYDTEASWRLMRNSRSLRLRARVDAFSFVALLSMRLVQA